MSTVSFKNIENKHDVWGKECMKKFCQYVGEHKIKIISFKTYIIHKREARIIEKKEKCENEYVKDNKYCKVRDHCHYTEKYWGRCSG